jgi:hypothetical protein
LLEWVGWETVVAPQASATVAWEYHLAEDMVRVSVSEWLTKFLKQLTLHFSEYFQKSERDQPPEFPLPTREANRSDSLTVFSFCASILPRPFLGKEMAGNWLLPPMMTKRANGTRFSRREASASERSGRLEAHVSPPPQIEIMQTQQ